MNNDDILEVIRKSCPHELTISQKSVEASHSWF